MQIFARATLSPGRCGYNPEALTRPANEVLKRLSICCQIRGVAGSEATGETQCSNSTHSRAGCASRASGATGASRSTPMRLTLGRRWNLFARRDGTDDNAGF